MAHRFAAQGPLVHQRKLIGRPSISTRISSWQQQTAAIGIGSKRGYWSNIRQAAGVIFSWRKIKKRDVRNTFEMRTVLQRILLRKIRQEMYAQEVASEGTGSYSSWSWSAESKALPTLPTAKAHREIIREITGDKIRKAWDEASKRMKKRSVYSVGNRILQYELQLEVGDDVQAVFDIMRKIDDRLPTAPDDEDNDYRVDDVHLDIVADDLKETNRLITQTKEDNDMSEKRKSNQLGFLYRKQGALQTLLEYHTGTKPDTDDNSHYHDSSKSSGGDKGKSDDSTEPKEATEREGRDDVTDDFGFDATSASEEVVKALRYHQTINVCRSACLKQELGYSVLALKSTIPGAGRGIFLDGEALTGSLIAFLPGDIWVRDYLVGEMSTELENYFAENHNRHLRLRPDEIIIDSRVSPYTVLKNPWAVGHIANHPPPNEFPNARLAPIDYHEEWNLEEKELARYVPNKYARKAPLLGTQLFNQHTVESQGLVLYASHELANEEIVYDYFLWEKKESFPDWYHPVDEEAWEGTVYADHFAEDHD